jgi:hypothetical protein
MNRFFDETVVVPQVNQKTENSFSDRQKWFPFLYVALKLLL